MDQHFETSVAERLGSLHETAVCGVGRLHSRGHLRPRGPSLAVGLVEQNSGEDSHPELGFQEKYVPSPTSASGRDRRSCNAASPAGSISLLSREPNRPTHRCPAFDSNRAT